MKTMYRTALPLMLVLLVGLPAHANEEARERVLVEFDAEDADRVREALRALPVTVSDVGPATGTAPADPDTASAAPISNEALDAMAAWEHLQKAASRAAEDRKPGFMHLTKFSVDAKAMHARFVVGDVATADRLAEEIASDPYFMSRAGSPAHGVVQGTLRRSKGNRFEQSLTYAFRAVRPDLTDRPPLEANPLPQQPIVDILEAAGAPITSIGGERRAEAADGSWRSVSRELRVPLTTMRALALALSELRAAAIPVTSLQWRWKTRDPASAPDAPIEASLVVTSLGCVLQAEGTQTPAHDAVAIWDDVVLALAGTVRLDEISISPRRLTLKVTSPDVDSVDGARAALQASPSLRARAADPLQVADLGAAGATDDGHFKADLQIRLSGGSKVVLAPADPERLSNASITAAAKTAGAGVVRIGALRQDVMRRTGQTEWSREFTTDKIDGLGRAHAVLFALKQAGMIVKEARWSPGARLVVKVARYEAIPADPK